MSLEASIAANRFGLGARPGELTAIGPNPKRWLLSQLEISKAQIEDNRLQTASAAFRGYLQYRDMRADVRRMTAGAMANTRPPAPDAANVVQLANFARETLGAETQARILHGATTTAPFLERWVLFWSNMLTMAATSLQKTPFAGPYEREAIRPYVLGRFEDLLIRANTHAGMLVYLDQVQSIGPNAPMANAAGRRGRQVGLNENLAREILELHTLGPDGGYTQADVQELAKALTGWTLAGPRVARFTRGTPDGEVVFIDAMHEPGSRTLLGRTFPAKGREQAVEMLSYLAAQPQVAKRVARRVAVHFVSDNPPKSLTDRLEANFIATRGDLKALARTLVESPESWAPQALKFKTPNDFLMSTLRGAGANDVRLNSLRSSFEQLGQAPFRAPSPKGWPEDAVSWAAPDAILKRADWSGLAADAISETTTPLQFAQTCLGTALSERTRIAVSRAESARQGLTLVLMSPEFQRR